MVMRTIFYSTFIIISTIYFKPLLAQQTDKAEMKKIQYLIDFVKNSELTFIRNNQEFSGKAAAEHLEMKLSKAGGKINNVNDFIDIIASKSSLSGKPYQVKLKNGSLINLRDLLYHELNKLNKANQ